MRGDARPAARAIQIIEFPPVGAVENQPIPDDNHRYRMFEAILGLVLLSVAFTGPFEFGFYDHPKSPFSLVEWLIRFFYVCDMGCTFFVPYRDPQTNILVHERRAIIIRYLTSFFVPDVISIFPFELVCRGLWCYGLSTVLRLWRLRKVVALFDRWEKDISINYFLIRSTKILCDTIFAIHCGACLFYKLAVLYRPRGRTWISEFMPDYMDRHVWARYSLSLYWSVTTFTTVGYGDITAINTWEFNFNVAYMLFVFVLATYTSVRFTNLVVHGAKIQQSDKVKDGWRFGLTHKLSAARRDEMVQGFRLNYRLESERLQEEKFLSLVPKALRYKIADDLFGSLVQGAYLFAGVSRGFLFQLTSEMKTEFFLPETEIILQNQAATEFYIIVTGRVELLINAAEGEQVVVGDASNGELCGEIAVLCSKDQLFTVRASTLTKMLRVEGECFFKFVEGRTEDASIMMRNIIQRLETLDYLRTDVISKHIKYTIEEGRSKLPLSPCYAAGTNNYVLLKHLLKNRGIDASEIDKEGKTPLHLAVEGGNLKCVEILLEFGAAVNRRDFSGKVPLWLAMMLGHGDVVLLLTEHEANLSKGDIGKFCADAFKSGKIHLLDDIIEHGGDIRLGCEKKGNTVLHRAVKRGDGELVSYLLGKGLNMDQANNQGLTPYSMAQEKGLTGIVELMDRAKNNAAVLDASGEVRLWLLIVKQLNDYPKVMRHLSSLAPLFRSEYHKLKKMMTRRPEKVLSYLLPFLV